MRKWQADDVIVATVHDWDDIHTPIVHATVKEITKDGRVIGETSTNEMGFFQLRLVAPENYIQITHNDSNHGDLSRLIKWGFDAT